MKDTKISVYKAVVLTTLLYGAESWVIYRRHLRLIKRYHQHCLRTILNIHWSDFVTNIDVLEMAMVTSIKAMLLKKKLLGNVCRMEDHRLPGHCDKGAPRKRYKDTLNRSFITCNIDYHQWTIQAANRTNWQHTVYQATTSFDVKRRANKEDKRKRRKKRDPSEINTGRIVTCSRCGKTCLSQIGLISHQRPAPDEDFLLPVSSFVNRAMT